MEKTAIVQSVTYIIAGALLQLISGIDDSWATLVVSIFGFVIFFVGLNQLKQAFNPKGQQAVGMLVLGAIIGAAGAVIDLIPLMGIFASVAYLIAFILELIGYSQLKNSSSLGPVGQNGITLIMVAMLLAILQSLFGLLPFVGGFIASVLAIGAFMLSFFGWIKVQEDIIRNTF